MNRVLNKIRSHHRSIALISGLPLIIIFASGILLSLSPYLSWLQPQVAPRNQELKLTFDEIFQIARAVPEAKIATWSDIQQIDVRPSSGLVRVRAKNYWEIQLSGGSGEILSSAPRRKTLLVTIHDGSFFGEWVKPGLFLPAGICALGLWITGMLIWCLPKIKRRKR